MKKMIIVTALCAVAAFFLGMKAQKHVQRPIENTVLICDHEDAKGAAINFLGSLFKKDYAKAASIYGGDYAQLLDWNPDIKASDKAALWERGCEQNGLSCLEVRNAAFASQPDPDTYVINVWFSMADKITEFKTADGRSTFPFTVVRTDSDAYQVTTMPVYTP